MEIKNIANDRMGLIAHALMNRVADFEGRYNGGFVRALGYDRITLDEASEFGFSFDKEDMIVHKIIFDYVGVGTYHLCFINEDTGLEDETEFYAEDSDELVDFWFDFCIENDFEHNCLIDVEYVCAEQI